MSSDPTVKLAKGINQNWLIPTKLQAPQQVAGFLERVQVLQPLNKNTKIKLCLVTAAAGYGKSSLLAAWYRTLLQKSYIRVWLNLDEDERDPEQFLAYLIVALSEAGLEGEQISSLLTSVQQGSISTSVKLAFAALINQIIQCGKKVVIILDDYHRAESDEVNQLLNTMVERMPDNLLLVIGSRIQPKIKTSALQLQGQLQQLTTEQLCFSRAEAQQILNGQQIKKEQLDFLMSLTEGWIAALQLAKIWVQKNDKTHVLDKESGFSGSVADVANYFTEQVLAYLPESHHGFLMKTAAAERFNVELADAICERNDSGRILKELLQLNAMLIPLDHQQNWYRYHPLFSEFLKERLKSRDSAEYIRLNLIASHWFQQHDYLSEAVKHCKIAGDFSRAAELIEEMGDWYVIIQGGAKDIDELLSDFPDKLLKQYPGLQLMQAFSLTKQGKLTEADLMLTKMPKYGQVDIKNKQGQVNSRHIAIQAVLANYRDDKVSPDELDFIKHFVKTLPQDDHNNRAALYDVATSLSLELGNLQSVEKYSFKCIEESQLGDYHISKSYSLLNLGESYLLQGDIGKAQQMYRQALDIAVEHLGDNSDLAAVVQVFLAEILYEQNDVDLCKKHLSSSLQHTAEHDGWLTVYLAGYKTKARLMHATKGLDAALSVLDQGQRIAAERNIPRQEFLLLCNKVQHLLLARNINAARQICEKENLTVDNFIAQKESYFWREYYAVGTCLANMAIIEQNTETALLVLNELEASSKAGQRHYHLIRIFMLYAICYWLRREKAEACNYIEKALELAEPQGLKSSFLDIGRPMEAILHYAEKQASKSKIKSYIKMLLREREHRREVYNPFASILSDRELEILEEIAQGDTDKEIARSLEISASTVNFHLRNVYKKLNVNTRKTAVAKAQEQDLISQYQS